MKSITQELLDFVMDTDFENLPEAVVHESKRIILDSMGCAVAGLSIDKGKISVALARRQGGPPLHQSLVRETKFHVPMLLSPNVQGQDFRYSFFD